ncbi:MAG: glycosyl hydrolase family 28-related protein [Verrucomicrobiae bacterium]
MSKSKPPKSTTPIILWHSDPVRPDETIIIQGEDFSADAVAELAAIPDSGSEGEPRWEKVSPLQSSSQSLKAVIPANWAPGLYRCRVSQNQAVSNEVILNAPDLWWIQGDAGQASARPGGWLRVFGKCLNLGVASQVALVSSKFEKVVLTLVESSGYSLKAEIPAALEPGAYQVLVSNGAGGDAGWRRAEDLAVLDAATAEPTVVNALDFGADPEGRKDCTLSIVQALERLCGLNGGVLYFPRGRYRVDSTLRSGMWISHPLKVPPGVTLRGEGMHLVSLWWPDQKDPLPTLIEGSSDFGVEDLSIFTQGRHRNIISGESNARIRRVRIRANCYYMTGLNGRAHHGRGVAEFAGGTALEFSGSHIEVTDCDIYHSAAAFSLKHVRGGLFANNTIRAANMVFISGGSGIIFENNSFEGNQLTAGGNNIALHFGASSCRHVYYAHNRVAHIYGGDHEALTLDGHGTAYIGKVREVRGTEVVLASSPVLGPDGIRDNMVSMDDTTLYVLSGRGAGQYRAIVSYSDRELNIDRPWLVEPDESSVVSIGGFNGRHLIIGNEAEDAGTLVQLYPPNCECIVAENRGIHSGGISSLSKLGLNENSRFQRVEPSWFNQFLDNHTVWGNAWGGGETEIDRWLGGEGYLNIWGWQVAFWVKEGADQDRSLTQEDVAKLLHASPESVSCIPLSRGQIVRRHLIDNNSSIRIRGAVVDVLVEKCVIKDSHRGIRVDSQPQKKHTEDLDMLYFEPDPEPTAPGQAQPFLSPKGVLLRKNEMLRVGVPYSGTAIEFAAGEKI